MSSMTRLACTGVLVALMAASACTSDNKTASTTTSAGKGQSQPRVPGASDRVVVRGNATLDGAPFDSRFVGAVVLRRGLVTPCQHTLPPVANGRYAVTVLAVVGPDSIAGCTRGATLTFHIDGHPAAPTNVVNTPPGQREALDLTLP